MTAALVKLGVQNLFAYFPFMSFCSPTDDMEDDSVLSGGKVRSKVGPLVQPASILRMNTSAHHVKHLQSHPSLANHSGLLEIKIKKSKLKCNVRFSLTSVIHLHPSVQPMIMTHRERQPRKRCL